MYIPFRLGWRQTFASCHVHLGLQENHGYRLSRSMETEYPVHTSCRPDYTSTVYPPFAWSRKKVSVKGHTRGIRVDPRTFPSMNHPFSVQDNRTRSPLPAIVLIYHVNTRGGAINIVEIERVTGKGWRRSFQRCYETCRVVTIERTSRN